MKKIHIDNSIFDGLAGVSADEALNIEAPQQSVSKNGTDFNHVIISFYLKDTEEESIPSEVVPISILYKMRNILNQRELEQRELYTRNVLNVVINHFEKYGKIQELRFIGHGAPHTMGDIGKQQFEIGWFLDGLANFEHTHGKVVNRIIFDGCNTFSNSNDYAVRYYSNYAKENHTELVGSTSEVVGITNLLGIHFEIGRYVQFSPTGKIIRDKLDTRYNPYMLFFENDRSWTDFYIGHTAEEGERIKKAHEERLQKNQKQMEAIIKKGGIF